MSCRSRSFSSCNASSAHDDDAPTRQTESAYCGIACALELTNGRRDQGGWANNLAVFDPIRGSHLPDLADLMNDLEFGGTATQSITFVDKVEFPFSDLQASLNAGPAIVGISTEPLKGAHYVLVDKVENSRVYIRDPAPEGSPKFGTAYSVTLSDFLDAYYGQALIQVPN